MATNALTFYARCSIHRYSQTRSTWTISKRILSEVVDYPPQVLLEHFTKPNELPGAVVSVMTLNRPKANAMGSVMLSQLKGCLTELELHDSESRCLVLTSCSDRVFSAGADLKERATMTINQAAAFVTDLRHTMDRLSNLPIPVIAAIEGVALGGGLEIALAADLRIASETSILGLPETSLAIVPGAGGTQRLPRLIGIARAKELIFTGTRINGVAAEKFGLVQYVVTPGLAKERALEIAWKIAKNGPAAIRAAKFAIDEGITATDMAEALSIERQAYERVLSTRDRLEGLNAFNEQRTPEYRGD